MNKKKVIEERQFEPKYKVTLPNGFQFARGYFESAKVLGTREFNADDFTLREMLCGVNEDEQHQALVDGLSDEQVFNQLKNYGFIIDTYGY